MRITLHRWVTVLLAATWVIAALLASGLAGSAQEKSDKAPAEAKQALPKGGNDINVGGPAGPADKPLRFEETRPGILFSAAMQTFAVANPVSVAALRVIAIEGETGALLERIADGTRNPNLATPIPWHERPEEDKAFIHLQWEALIDSKIVPAELFKKAGEEKENRWITFDDLWNRPSEHRGKIIAVKGKLIRLRAHKITKPEATAQGIDFIYEGWVVGQTPKRNPYCIVFVTLPDGLEPQETMDQPVTFYGYYIKKYRYDAQNTVRETHLLIGPTVILGKAPTAVPATQDIFSRDFLYVVSGGVFALALVLWGLHLWFRRSDRAVHDKLMSYRERQLDLGDEPVAPTAAPTGAASPEREPDRLPGDDVARPADGV
jgi:hypothetical protein